MRQIVLDTETTGLYVDQGHRIIEIGCVELVNRKLTGKHFHQYINPQRQIDEGALAIHGINQDFLADKPLFCDIAHQLIEFIQDSELIIHNAPFDVGFLNAELALLKKWNQLHHYCRVVDTLTLAKQLHVGQRNSLDALCKRYVIDNSHREFHGALLDAHLLARVYLAMTGGQANLFGNIENQEANNLLQNTQTVANTTARNLPLINADAIELAAHEQFLKNMLTKGKCVWAEAKGE
jgi:DNA polymerase III subunit epsilon